jgi:hypothetical protein
MTQPRLKVMGEVSTTAGSSNPSAFIRAMGRP